MDSITQKPTFRKKIERTRIDFEQSKIDAIFAPFGSVFIRVSPNVNTIIGNMNATVLLMQILYWQGRGQREDGWIYKTRDEFSKELGMTLNEYDTARKLLRTFRLIEEAQVKGTVRTLHFRPNLEMIEKVIQDYLADPNWFEPLSRRTDKRKTNTVSSRTKEVREKEMSRGNQREKPITDKTQLPVWKKAKEQMGNDSTRMSDNIQDGIEGVYGIGTTQPPSLSTAIDYSSKTTTKKEHEINNQNEVYPIEKGLAKLIKSESGELHNDSDSDLINSRIFNLNSGDCITENSHRDSVRHITQSQPHKEEDANITNISEVSPNEGGEDAYGNHFVIQTAETEEKTVNAVRAESVAQDEEQGTRLVKNITMINEPKRGRPMGSTNKANIEHGIADNLPAKPFTRDDEKERNNNYYMGNGSPAQRLCAYWCELCGRSWQDEIFKPKLTKQMQSLVDTGITWNEFDELHDYCCSLYPHTKNGKRIYDSYPEPVFLASKFAEWKAKNRKNVALTKVAEVARQAYTPEIAKARDKERNRMLEEKRKKNEEYRKRLLVTK